MIRTALLTMLLFAVVVSPAQATGWTWPVTGEILSDYRNGDDPYASGQHRGIDIAAAVGHPVVAATDGTVAFAGAAGLSGLTVSVRTGDGRFDTSYLHLAEAEVRRGDRVTAGERIGAVGTSGRRSVEAPHLHFGVRDAGTDHGYRNPLDFLPAPLPPAGEPQPPPLPVPLPVPVPPAPAPVGAAGQSPVPMTLPLPAPLGVRSPVALPSPGALPVSTALPSPAPATLPILGPVGPRESLPGPTPRHWAAPSHASSPGPVPSAARSGSPAPNPPSLTPPGVDRTPGRRSDALPGIDRAERVRAASAVGSAPARRRLEPAVDRGPGTGPRAQHHAGARLGSRGRLHGENPSRTPDEDPSSAPGGGIDVGWWLACGALLAVAATLGPAASRRTAMSGGRGTLLHGLRLLANRR